MRQALTDVSAHVQDVGDEQITQDSGDLSRHTPFATPRGRQPLMARRRHWRLVIDTMAVIRGARAFRQAPPEPTTAERRLILGWIDDDAVFDWLYNQLILDEYRAILGRLKVPAHASGRLINLLRQGGTEVEVQISEGFHRTLKTIPSITVPSLAMPMTW